MGPHPTLQSTLAAHRTVVGQVAATLALPPRSPARAPFVAPPWTAPTMRRRTIVTFSLNVDVPAFATSRRMSLPDMGLAMIATAAMSGNIAGRVLDATQPAWGHPLRLELRRAPEWNGAT